ncbi:hypothetical protein [Spiribacter pallidus]|uniref:hypothetical protein n=1 Tax=Spiribacter pallidus TaxID=1987936 RepID=UPI0034A02202
MKVCIFGNKSTTKELAEHLINKGVDIDCLVCLESGAMARATISGSFEGMRQWAIEKGISVYSPSSYSLRSERDQEFFSKERFDLGLCTGWQRIIPLEILESFKIGVFGWHGSGFQFPNGRGRSPLNWTIRLGLTSVFHNCFRYSAYADAGHVFETEKIAVHPEDYIADLQAKAVVHIKESSTRLLSAIQREDLVLSPQPPHPIIELPALDESSGEIFPAAMTSKAIVDLVRSCSRPFPGAFIKSKKGSIRVWRAKFLRHGVEKIPEDKVMIDDGVLHIAALDGFVSSDDFEML